MKKFVFSFQYLLDAHCAKEQAAEQALFQAIREKAAADQALLALNQLREHRVKAIEGMSGVVNRSDFGSRIRNIGDLQRERDALEETLRQRDRRVEECRENLRNETTSRRMLENLCDRERDEWAEALRVDEQKTMDELAAVRWSRRERLI